MPDKKTVKSIKPAKVAKADTALTKEALDTRLVELKKNQMNLRFQHSVGQLPKTHEIRKNRREIARTKTAIAQQSKN
jgi:large subunit ribosomal protein L29